MARQRSFRNAPATRKNRVALGDIITFSKEKENCQDTLVIGYSFELVRPINSSRLNEFYWRLQFEAILRVNKVQSGQTQNDLKTVISRLLRPTNQVKESFRRRVCFYICQRPEIFWLKSSLFFRFLIAKPVNLEADRLPGKSIFVPRQGKRTRQNQSRTKCSVKNLDAQDFRLKIVTRTHWARLAMARKSIRWKAKAKSKNQNRRKAAANRSKREQLTPAR